MTVDVSSDFCSIMTIEWGVFDRQSIKMAKNVHANGRIMLNDRPTEIVPAVTSPTVKGNVSDFP